MKSQNEQRKRWVQRLSRRWFLRDCGVGLGASALTSLLARDMPGKEARTHFEAKAKRVVYLFHAGAPSHLELFDPKPELTKRDGQLPPSELLKDYRAAFINPNSKLLGPKFNFHPHGQSGTELSELLPHISKLTDEICLIRSLYTEAVNHAPAQIMLNTGSQQFGRPSLG
ncbi:MAG: DUF1501 domain-containing protein, partial [Verrucomicrobia bacterium]|nr:DUF1501 domain-containing protein [Verrucomicrobiota bacterium]